MQSVGAKTVKYEHHDGADIRDSKSSESMDHHDNRGVKREVKQPADGELLRVHAVGF